jgi:DNA repair protein RecO (recombination protein O)
MQRGELTAAFVLHTRRYGDTSLLVELFGETFGRVVCVARGALTARRAGARPQAFQPLLVAVSGRGEVQTLSRIEPSGGGPALVGKGLYCGLYLNELLLKMTARGDPLPDLYARYAETLHLLGSDTPAEPVLRRFEIALLEELGHGLVLDVDENGLPIDSAARYLYRIEGGPRRVDTEAARGYRGETLRALAMGEFSTPEIQREARVFMREVIDHHLGGKPIRSRELFR